MRHELQCRQLGRLPACCNLQQLHCCPWLQVTAASMSMQEGACVCAHVRTFIPNHFVIWHWKESRGRAA